MKKPILRLDAGSATWAAADAWQRRLHARRLAHEIPDVLLLLEHPHVYTLGRMFRPEHLRAGPAELRRRGARVVEADRGGSITYHGPGQIVVYAIVDLRRPDGRPPDLLGYLRRLEQATVAAALRFGVEAYARPGLTGVWAAGRKLASIGVNVSRGVSRHGLALNVTTDLSYFDGMDPCGLPGVEMASLQSLTGRWTPGAAVADALVQELAGQLGRRAEPATWADLDLAPDPPEPGRTLAGARA